jgi:hypothetical protein
MGISGGGVIWLRVARNVDLISKTIIRDFGNPTVVFLIFVATDFSAFAASFISLATCQFIST